MSSSKKKEEMPKTGYASVNPNMRDYSKEAFFVEKTERAREFLAKSNLRSLEELMKK